MYFTDDEQLRYSRQIILPQIGLAGQKKLKESSLLIIGAGGLGSPVGLYGAAAGIGTLGIADYDCVDISNLNRQILHTTHSVGTPKSDSARDTLTKLNPHLAITTYSSKIDTSNINAIVRKYDCVIDATDSFEAKFLINDTCIQERIPFVHAGVIGMAGQIMTVLPKETACYRCLFKEPPPSNSVGSCASEGILGSIAGVIGALQVTEAIKIICTIGQLLTNKLLTFDGETMEFRTIAVRADPTCRACSSQVP